MKPLCEDDQTYINHIRNCHPEIPGNRLAEIISAFIPGISEELLSKQSSQRPDPAEASTNVLEHPSHRTTSNEGLYENPEPTYPHHLVERASAIRRRLRLTQAEFASRLGMSHRTWQEWEQGRRAPTGAARALLASFLAG